MGNNRDDVCSTPTGVGMQAGAGGPVKLVADSEKTTQSVVIARIAHAAAFRTLDKLRTSTVSEVLSMQAPWPHLSPTRQKWFHDVVADWMATHEVEAALLQEADPEHCQSREELVRELTDSREQVAALRRQVQAYEAVVAERCAATSECRAGEDLDPGDMVVVKSDYAVILEAMLASARDDVAKLEQDCQNMRQELDIACAARKSVEERANKVLSATCAKNRELQEINEALSQKAEKLRNKCADQAVHIADLDRQYNSILDETIEIAGILGVDTNGPYDLIREAQDVADQACEQTILCGIVGEHRDFLVSSLLTVANALGVQTTRNILPTIFGMQRELRRLRKALGER